MRKLQKQSRQEKILFADSPSFLSCSELSVLKKLMLLLSAVIKPAIEIQNVISA